MKRNKLAWIQVMGLLIFLMALITVNGVIPRHQSTSSIRFVTEQLSKQGYSSTETQSIQNKLPIDIQIRLSTQPYQKYAVERNLDPFFEDLLELGYTKKEIDVLSQLDLFILIQVMDREEIDDPAAWFKTDFFLSDRFIRYLDFQASKSSYSHRKIVELVNANRDREAYTQVVLADLDAVILLVNKYHMVPQDYVPEPLIKAQGCGQPILQTKAAHAYDLMCQAITAAQYPLSTSTAYRSYSFQSSLYNKYLKLYGREATDKFAARPGFSEHQTGLAVDVKADSGGRELFVNTDTYQWMINNADRFGFILRYPLGKEDVTGYQFESWHYTYVGIDIAKWIKSQGITLDEAALFIK